MNIGIDIDGTITTPYYWRKLFNRLFDKNIQEKDCIHYDLSKIYETDKDFWHEVNNTHRKDFFDSVDIRCDALEIINLLKNDKEYNCCFITARQDDEYTIQRTNEYLKLYAIDDIDLHMLSSHYKVDKAKELNIDVFIEDSPKNAFELAESGIKVFLINTYYNQDVKHENIIRVYNWFEIYEKIKELKEKF